MILTIVFVLIASIKMIQVNLLPRITYNMQNRLPGKENLFIPKKFWSISETRFLTFREVIESFDRYTYKNSRTEYGVELVHNTPAEISGVAREMTERLRGTWRTTEEDEQLQRRFVALAGPNHTGYGLSARIGAEFLKEHQDLLA